MRRQRKDEEDRIVERRTADRKSTVIHVLSKRLSMQELKTIV